MRTIVISGANKGIGYEAASQLAAAGHRVWLGSRDADRGRQAAERAGARFLQLDVTDDSSVEAAARTVADAGGLDVLVNNAGIAPEYDPEKVAVGAGELTADLMRDTFETNVFGTVRMLHAFLPLLQRSSSPVVVNVSSGLSSLNRLSDPASRQHHYPGVAYPASKAAVNVLTVQYAKAFPEIKINSVEPGFTATDLNAGSGAQSPAQAAKLIIAMADLGPDGPSGGLFDATGPMSW